MSKTSTVALLLVTLLAATAFFALRPPAAAAPPTNPEAVDRMVTAAEKMNNTLADLSDIRRNLPEFQQFRIFWQKRLLQAKYLQPTGDAAHQTAFDAYIKALRTMREETQARTDLVAGQEHPFDYALAEADYFKATGKWP